MMEMQARHHKRSIACPARRLTRRAAGWWLLALWLAAVWPSAVRADAGQPQRPPTPDDFLAAATLEQRLNAQVPLDLRFQDETGASVRLGDYLGQRPAILALGYYECPTLCNLTFNELATNLRAISLEVGRDFQIITVSIDPRETPRQARAEQQRLLALYGRPEAENGWHFLTGPEAQIKRLADAVGFHYAYDQRLDQYAHPSAIMLLTPEGKISHYLYGMQYSASDLRLGLVEASAGQIGSPIDKVLLRCYNYDPVSGTYQFVVMNALRLGGSLTVLILAAAVIMMLRRERRSSSPRPAPGS